MNINKISETRKFQSEYEINSENSFNFREIENTPFKPSLPGFLMVMLLAE